VDAFLDIYQVSLNKHGEELCGDQVRVLKTPPVTTIVLSDGLGSGVKANILATLTAEIITTMLREAVDLREVIDTVIRTLPVCKERHIAYATFTILTIDQRDDSFRVINFDNPEPFYLKDGKIVKLESAKEKILKKTISVSQGKLEMGDFIGLISDGVLYAGLGTTMNFGWGWENVGKFMEAGFENRVFAAHTIVNGVMNMTNQLYGWQAGDDATFVGLLARKRNALMVFSGPPLDNGFDYVYVDRLLDFKGRKVVCGGTTANIVASFLKTRVETVMSSLDDAVPPIGRLPGIDLVTEGILTLAAVLDLLEKSGGSLDRLVAANNGAYLLAREMLVADTVQFLVGQSINPFYQNPLLPKNISIRRYLIDQIAGVLTGFNKDVQIDYC
jgi:hypothetical protein